jgi:hypothetical protein
VPVLFDARNIRRFFRTSKQLTLLIFVSEEFVVGFVEVFLNII